MSIPARHAPNQQRFYGKYRGQVVDNIDPMELNRLLVEVPTLPGTATSWAMPCQPYGGLQVGLVLTPPIGANVWIEFENGDPSYPVWVGCFWTEGEKPALAELPTQQVLSTGSVNIMINDVDGAGEFLAEFGPPGFEVPVTLTITTEGVTLTVAETVLSLTPEEASYLIEPTSIVATEEGIVVETTGDVDITAAETSIEGNVTQVGAVEVEGDMEITGAVEIVGDVEITGAVEIEGEVEIVGALEVEGEVEIAGAVEMEGEIEMAGAIEMEGEIAGAGAMEFGGEVAIGGAVEVGGEVAIGGAVEIGGVLVSSTYTPSVGNLL